MRFLPNNMSGKYKVHGMFCFKDEFVPSPVLRLSLAPGITGRTIFDPHTFKLQRFIVKMLIQ